MILGIISDTHDRLENIDKAFDVFAGSAVEHIIHCGDWKSLGTLMYFLERATHYSLPVDGVLGNNDLDSQAFLTAALTYSRRINIQEGILDLTLGGKRCAVYHGHHTPTLRKLRENDDYSFVFLGHTHKPRIEKENNKLIVNPGSVAFSIPRSKQWQPTVAIVNTENMSVDIVEI